MRPSTASPGKMKITADLRAIWLGKIRSVTTVAGLACSLALLPISGALAGTNVSSTPSVSETGEAIGYTVDAVSLSNSYGTQTCTLTPSRNFNITLPLGATVRKAILYWATDVTNGDSQVSLAGNTINAAQSWNDKIQTTTKIFYGYRADVTSQITGTGTYNFGGLGGDLTSPFYGGCVSGASLIVIYDTTRSDPNALNRIEMFDGFEGIRGAGLADGGVSSTVTLPINSLGSDLSFMTALSWQGNFVNEPPAGGGYPDSLTVNGTAVFNTNNPVNDNGNGSGANQAPNSVYAVDADTYNVSSIVGGSTAVTLTNASGNFDYVISQGFVFGSRGPDVSDAPNSGGLNYGIARHKIVPTLINPLLYLGSTVDGEIVNTTYAGNTNADFDNTNGVNDDDGITLPTLTVGATSYSIPVSNITAQGTGTLHAWIDFNKNGTFDAGEHASVAVTNNTPAGALNWTGITAGAAGNTYARFRFTSDVTVTASTPSGLAANGEVEDYLVPIVPMPVNISGTLYKDNNSNNTNDSEPALAANVTATLYNDANANNTIDVGEQLGSPVVTNASGQYSFATVPAGTYKIKVDTADTDIPAGYTLGTANDITATVTNANVTGKDFGFDIAAGFCNLGDGTPDVAIADYISPEVTNNLTATRSLTDTLDDAWRTATGGLSSGTVTPWFGTDTKGSVSNFIYLDPATSTSVNATVELVLVNISGLTNCAGIPNATSSTPLLSTGAALQDTSPRPTSLYNSANQPAFWNQTTAPVDDNRRFAARFTFDKPVKSFGAWFGDLETRTANGTPAILRLLDASGNRIGNDIPIQPTNLYDGTSPNPEAVDQNQCGSSAPGTNIGCGNSSTRWVSFVDNNSIPRISQVLVIVGDDDFNDNGDTEILSFIGANILPAVASNPNVLLVKRITSINNSTTTRGGDNLALYKDEVSNPYDDNQITVTSPNPPTTPADTNKWVDADNNGEPDLIGGINGGNVRPSDEIEYTIYYLSAGDTTAKNVLICDRIPENATFMPTAFNSFATKNTTGLPTGDRGIIWQNNGATESLTNISDDDTAEYLSPGVDPAIKYPGIKCDGTNTNGVVVVNLGNLPNAIAPGTPTSSYGFIRFRGRVK